MRRVEIGSNPLDRRSKSIGSLGGAPLIDVNRGKDWSDMDDFDMRNSHDEGDTVEEIASFLCRDVEEVCARGRHLGLLRLREP
jgi:hypothetical protein